MFQQQADVPAGIGKTDVISSAQGPARGREDRRLTRQHIIDDVLKILTSESGRGVILVGEHGAGKSFVAQRALEQLGDEYLVVQVRGSSISSKLPYGALSVLLNDLDSSHLEHPLMVLRGLIQLLHAKAQGRAIVLFVDNAHDLDDLSSMMVAQLSAGRHVTLLAACVAFPDIGGDIVGLWKDDLLRRVDLEPFDFAETAATLNQEYGGRFSHTAVRALWTASGGNALFLHSLAREQIKLGAITRHDGTWVLGTRPVSLTGEIRDVVKARMNRLSPGQRDVYELLALAGAVPLQTLMSIFSPHDMDDLQERGLIQVSHDHPPTVRVANPVTAAIVASVVPPGRSAELRRRLKAVLSGDEELEPGGPTGVSWALDCGERLSPGLALAAARCANDSSSPATALRFLQSADGVEAFPAAAIEAVRAHISLGNDEAARRILQKLMGSAENDLPVADWVTANLLLVQLDQGNPVTKAGAPAQLKALSQRLSTPEAGADPAAAHARAELLLAEARFAAHDGRYVDVLRVRDALDVAALGTEAELLLASLLCEAMAVTGDVIGAKALRKQVIAAAANVPLSDQSARELRGRFLLLMLLSAKFREVSDFLMATADTAEPQERLGGMFEISQGVVDLHAGNLDQAVPALEAGMQQLRQQDPDVVSGLATAVCAYAAGLAGDEEKAARLLSDLAQPRSQSSWLVGRITRYFELCTLAELGQRPAAVRSLVAEGEDDTEAPATALLFLSAAARLGDRQRCQKLAGVAGQVSGQFALLCLRLAQGVDEGSSEQLLSAARDADAAGNAVFARDASRRAVYCANEAGNRVALRISQRTEQALDGRFGSPKNGLHSLTTSTLTARECEVAVRAAAGTSNRKIAEQMHVSVRTVEGHLYQVYAKLHVAGRSELRDVISGPMAGARIG